MVCLETELFTRIDFIVYRVEVVVYWKRVVNSAFLKWRYRLNLNCGIIQLNDNNLQN
jgi:hypothetical protein